MAISLVINGTGYSYPQTGDSSWGDNTTNWASAVTSGMLQKAGGTFTLTADVDFGASFGLKSAYFTSRTANPATTGALRLANVDSLSFRNSGNSGDIALLPHADGILQYNSVDLVNLSASQVLTNKSISGSTNTLSAIPYSALVLTGAIVNADISASAAIAYSKLALTGAILNADLAGSIAYSKLVLTGAILNADLAGSIAYSKLVLTGAILNADLAGSIAVSKLVAQTINRAMTSDGSGFLAPSATTATELGYVSGVTSAIQTQLNAKQATGNYITALTGDVTAAGPGSVAATIAANAVTNAKAAQMAAHTFKGNNTGSTANALDLTATQLTAELNALVGDSGAGGTKGLAPAPASGDAAAGKYLKADGTWATVSVTATIKVATIQDQKTAGTYGGGFTAGAWRTRDLNTLNDPSSIVTSVASNQFVLPAGTYRIFATAPARTASKHRAKLRNITDSADTVMGQTSSAPVGTTVMTSSIVSGVFTLAGSKTFEIQHWCSSTEGTDGMGDISPDGGVEIYTQVELTKLS